MPLSGKKTGPKVRPGGRYLFCTSPRAAVGSLRRRRRRCVRISVTARAVPGLARRGSSKQLRARSGPSAGRAGPRPPGGRPGAYKNLLPRRQASELRALGAARYALVRVAVGAVGAGVGVLGVRPATQGAARASERASGASTGENTLTGARVLVLGARRTPGAVVRRLPHSGGACSGDGGGDAQQHAEQNCAHTCDEPQDSLSACRARSDASP